MEMDLDTGQDCPPSGCWWQRVDIMRRILSFLPTNKDVLVCDLVCREWAVLKAPFRHTLTIEAVDLRQPDAAAWLRRNLCRVRRLVLRGDQAAMLLNLSTAAALVSLEVVDCATLKQLPTGLGECKRLTSLQFNKCPFLQRLPEDLASMTGLQELALLGSPSSLGQIPDSIAALTELQDLKLHGCHNLQEVPAVIGTLSALTCLHVNMNCDMSELLPSLQLPARLTTVSTSISQLTNLQHLTIRGANQLRQLPDVLDGLSSLLKLELIGLHALTELPSSMGNLPALTQLVIFGADGLERVPTTLGNLGGTLKVLQISHCHKMLSIPPVVGELHSLEHLHLGCHGLMEHLPDTLGGLTSLTHLSIETASLNNLPDSVGKLSALRELKLQYCHCLQEIPESIGNLTLLELLSIDTCMHITALPDSLTQLQALTQLRLHCAEAWPVQLPALPAGIGRLPNLRKLLMTTSYPLDHSSMPLLPASLAASTSLQELHWGNLRLQPAARSAAAAGEDLSEVPGGAFGAFL